MSEKFTSGTENPKQTKIIITSRSKRGHVLRSAERLSTNVCFLNKIFDVIFYCSLGAGSRAVVLLNAALVVREVYMACFFATAIFSVSAGET